MPTEFIEPCSLSRGDTSIRGEATRGSVSTLVMEGCSHEEPVTESALAWQTLARGAIEVRTCRGRSVQAAHATIDTFSVCAICGLVPWPRFGIARLLVSKRKLLDGAAAHGYKGLRIVLFILLEQRRIQKDRVSYTVLSAIFVLSGYFFAVANAV
jgi:hypothetical protein